MAGPGFFAPPQADAYVLRNLTAPACLLAGIDAPLAANAGSLMRIDLAVSDGRIAAMRPADPAASAEDGPNLDGAMVLPGLVDCHAHLDKGHIWPRAQSDRRCPRRGDGDRK